MFIGYNLSKWKVIFLLHNYNNVNKLLIRNYIINTMLVERFVSQTTFAFLVVSNNSKDLKVYKYHITRNYKENITWVQILLGRKYNN